MKRYLLKIAFTAGWLIAFTAASAQTDSVDLSTNNAKQVYYSLAKGTVKSVDLDAWDLAFSASTRGSDIRFNAASGANLYLYPKGNTSAWNSIDTSGISGWSKLYDADTAWGTTAFERHTSSDLDVGWGLYSTTTHAITGDSLYIVQLSDNSFRKLWIEKLVGGKYEFAFAKLDGSDSTHVTFDKADYTNKNFGYYSLRDKKQLDLEPKQMDWDLVFTRYLGELAPNYYYGVTGVLCNTKVKIAKYTSTDTASQLTPKDSDYSSKINTIGYNWKVYNRSNHTYTIQDSLVFMVKSMNDDTWKVIMTGYGGGKITLQKKMENNGRLANNSNIVIRNQNTAFYPNPLQQGQPLFIEAEEGQSIAVSIFNMQGAIVWEGNVAPHAPINLPDLEGGMYIVRAQGSDKQIESHKLIIQH